jgi:hypothetical protein
MIRLGGKRPRRAVVAAMADSHGGCAVGLLNPQTTLYHEGSVSGELEPWTPPQNEMNRYLWSCYCEDIAAVQELAGKDEIIVVHDGDVTHGERYDGLVPGITREDQWFIAFFNLMPWLEIDNVSTVLLYTGTEVHDHLGTSSEVRVANLIRSEYPDKKVYVRHHGILNVDGVRFDISHHGPGGGSRKWLVGNVAELYLKDRLLREHERKRNPPRIFVRGHYHVNVWVSWRDNWNERHRIHDLVIVPSYCGVNWHARKSSKSDPELWNGLYAFEIDGGRLAGVYPNVRWRDMRTEDVL